MGIVTTYICDVSGKQGPATEFVTVRISVKTEQKPFFDPVVLDKVVHIDVARKLHLIPQVKNEEPTPEPTLESKLLVLLKEYVSDIAYNAAEEANSNRN